VQESAESHRKASHIRNFMAAVVAAPNDKVTPETVMCWQEWALSQAPLATGQIWEQIKHVD
jgi:hypothetical protein